MVEVARAIHFYEAILATLTIIVWHFYSVIFDPDVYPMNWAWITGYLTEHEMATEHGGHLEKIRAEEKAQLTEFGEAGAMGGGRIIPFPQEREGKPSSLRHFYGIVKGLNEAMKDWKGK
jgi:hypothetical protein